jgi:hypothetical protein
MERGDEALSRFEVVHGTAPIKAVIVRLDRTTQYAVTPALIINASYYWVTRFRG